MTVPPQPNPNPEGVKPLRPQHIYIGMAHAGIITFGTSNTLALMAYWQGKAGNNFDIIGVKSCLVSDNANNIMEIARTMPCDWLFFLDYDVRYTKFDDILGFMMSLDKDVVGGVYYQGEFPYRPVVYNFTDEGFIRNYLDVPEGLFKPGAVGGGFLLIKKKVLDLFTPELVNQIGAPFDPINDGNVVKLRADAAFMWRLKQLGVEVWAHSGIPLRHIKEDEIGPEHFEKAKEFIRKQENAKPTQNNR